MWLTALLAVCAAAAFLFYRKRKSAQQSLQACGIPSPPAHWLMGNLKGISNEHPLVEAVNEWTQQFGKIYGYYEGPDPTIVIGDPDMVQEVFVRQFSTFHGRKRFPFQEDPNTAKRVSMFTAEGERWKRLRTIINPAFTESKMRMMFPLIKANVDRLLAMLDTTAATGGPVDVYEHYKRLTLDVISECAFGVELDTQNTPSNKVFNMLKNFFDVQLVKRGWLLTAAQALPELKPIIRFFIRILSSLSPARQKRMFILDEMNKVIAERRKSPEARRVDILQLLLDAEADDVNKSQENGMPRAKALTTEEIEEQAMLFLFAGYETSSTALAYISHSLAIHPEVQEMLRAEVDALYEELGDAAEENYERLGGLTYMNNVINETLRCYPIAPQVISRRCPKTFKIGKYTIPEGSSVLADVYALHFNPELWGPIDPNVYSPERWEGSPKRHPAAWIPFGIGPRFCVGQRFALMEIRATLLRLVRRFNIKQCAETEVPIKLKYGPTVTPLNKLQVTLELRDHAAEAE